MFTQSDRDFYALRAQQERQASLNAQGEAARLGHLKMAHRYDALAQRAPVANTPPSAECPVVNFII